MRLTRVRITGFKTFADRTDVNLDGDMIAVVGPNGCGKSNFVDAVLWALGEANPRNLRAQTGQDVIFSGSAKRKPVGFAEVTLIFDNEDGSLPIDQAEVAVTRRLTRSGDSHYFINKQACRLRDVYDLLADTGLGKTGYAIVGQKEIDAALAASPEERRAWVDEAAGIQRFRLRRQEAFRRLEGVEGHLNRIDDIVREIDSQRAPLEREAETARKFKGVQSALREVECSLLAKEIREANEDLASASDRTVNALAAQTRLTEEIAAIKAEMGVAASTVSALEQEQDVVRGLQQGSLTAVERAKARIQVAEQKLQSLQDLEASLEDSDKDQELRIQELLSDRDRVRAQVETASEEVELLESERAAIDAEHGEAIAKLKQIDEELAIAKASHARWLEFQGAAAERRQRLKECRRELEGILKALPELEAAIADSSTRFGEAEAALSALQAQVLAEVKEREDKRRSLDHLAARSREVLAEQSGVEGRMRALQATVDSHEGLSQGAHAVLDLVREGRLSGTYVPVVEAIQVEPRYAQAVESALGAAANDLIVEREQDAKSAIRLLKENRLGRATFQPVTLMRPYARPDAREALADAGILGFACDFVTCLSDHEPVVYSLLGRVLVAESIDAALRVAKTPGWSRVVTLEGEIVHSAGSVTGGISPRNANGILQRKAEVAALDTRLHELAASLAQLNQESECLQAELESVSEAIDLEAASRDLKDAERWHSDLLREMKEATRSRERLEAEISSLGTVEQPTEAPDLTEIEGRREAQFRLVTSGDAGREHYGSRLAELTARRDELAAVLESAEQRITQSTDRMARRQRASEQIGPERALWTTHLETAKADLAVAEEDRRTADERFEQVTGQRQAALERSYQLDEVAKKLEGDTKLQDEELHRSELLKSRAEARRATAAQRLMEEYGLTPEELARAETGDLPDDAAATVQRLRRELRSFGDVNLGAIEAYERLSTRYAEIDLQRQDIEESRSQIQQTITELDSAAKGRFLETFARLQVAFSGIFHRIFGGGEANLVLSEAESILDAGVYIEVTIPGKRKQRAELLSGGERALCACAFLFALLQIKPSPLVVLDEVDAPLDGRNVERFIDLIRSFAGTTQFIVVTHNNVTIAAAPIWFGVTMNEPGVSTVILYRYPDQNLVREVVPDAYLKG
ncbi:MAG: Chromosome partition protein Smc [Fimbriimonadaceae bacterium]|nr:Chromosome partition protein Smc [Fimbriimonadaceae bacterium]